MTANLINLEKEAIKIIDSTVLSVVALGWVFVAFPFGNYFENSLNSLAKKMYKDIAKEFNINEEILNNENNWVKKDIGVYCEIEYKSLFLVRFLPIFGQIGKIEIACKIIRESGNDIIMYCKENYRLVAIKKYYI